MKFLPDAECNYCTTHCTLFCFDKTCSLYQGKFILNELREAADRGVSKILVVVGSRDVSPEILLEIML